jgi:hypothetical protein
MPAEILPETAAGVHCERLLILFGILKYPAFRSTKYILEL